MSAIMQPCKMLWCCLWQYLYFWIWLLVVDVQSASFTSSQIGKRKNLKWKQTLLYNSSVIQTPSYILRTSIQLPNVQFAILLETANLTPLAILSVFYLFYSFLLFQEIHKHIISRVAPNWNFLLHLEFHPLPS
jgi:hypothetical protein